MQKRLEREKNASSPPTAAPTTESAAADVLRAGIAAEEALEKQQGRTGGFDQTRNLRQQRLALKEKRVPRRLPLIAAGLTVAVIGAAAYLVLRHEELPPGVIRAGEPLKLKLEFAFPAAQR